MFFFSFFLLYMLEGSCWLCKTSESLLLTYGWEIVEAEQEAMRNSVRVTVYIWASAMEEGEVLSEGKRKQ